VSAGTDTWTDTAAQAAHRRFSLVVSEMDRIAAAVTAFPESMRQLVYYGLLALLDPEPEDEADAQPGGYSSGEWSRRHHAELTGQIDRLAETITRCVPGEPSRSEGAVDVAIRLIEGWAGRGMPMTGLDHVADHPPAARHLPPGLLDRMIAGAVRLDTWARTGYAQNLFVHGLLELARHGDLTALPTGYDPYLDEAPSPPPTPQQEEPTPVQVGPDQFLPDAYTRDSADGGR
jgi:hypothetical protein